MSINIYLENERICEACGNYCNYHSLDNLNKENISLIPFNPLNTSHIWAVSYSLYLFHSSFQLLGCLLF